MAALAIGGCGDDDDGSAGDAFKAVEQQEAERSQQQREIAAPRWEPLRTFRGSGDATETITIDEEAIRWRASWTCERGKFELTANGAEFGSEDCPGDGRWSSIDTGEFELRVTATGPWRLTIYQQVESPLREAPPEEIASGAAELIAEEASTGSRTGGRARPGCIACRMVGSRSGWRDSARQRTPICSYGSARTPAPGPPSRR